jgi:hypothetical protein
MPKQQSQMIVVCKVHNIYLQQNSIFLYFSPSLYMTPQDGQAYCDQTYGAQMMVPNSRDEAAFIGNFLATLQVCAEPHCYFLH